MIEPIHNKIFFQRKYLSVQEEYDEVHKIVSEYAASIHNFFGEYAESMEKTKTKFDEFLFKTKNILDLIFSTQIESNEQRTISRYCPLTTG